VDADGQSLIASGEQELAASSRLQAGTLSFAETERLLQLASLTWPLGAKEVQRRVSSHNRSSAVCRSRKWIVPCDSATDDGVNTGRADTAPTRSP
jgi:hypothetical protein